MAETPVFFTWFHRNHKSEREKFDKNLTSTFENANPRLHLRLPWMNLHYIHDDIF